MKSVSDMTGVRDPKPPHETSRMTGRLSGWKSEVSEREDQINGGEEAGWLPPFLSVVWSSIFVSVRMDTILCSKERTMRTYTVDQVIDMMVQRAIDCPTDVILKWQHDLRDAPIHYLWDIANPVDEGNFEFSINHACILFQARALIGRQNAARLVSLFNMEACRQVAEIGADVQSQEIEHAYTKFYYIMAQKLRLPILISIYRQVLTENQHLLIGAESSFHRIIGVQDAQLSEDSSGEGVAEAQSIRVGSTTIRGFVTPEEWDALLRAGLAEEIQSLLETQSPAGRILIER